MNLESPKVTVEKSAQHLFDALSNVKNFEKLMPENISKFEVLGDDIFNFGLKGMPEIKLRLKETTPHYSGGTVLDFHQPSLLSPKGHLFCYYSVCYSIPSFSKLTNNNNILKKMFFMILTP